MALWNGTFSLSSTTLYQYNNSPGTGGLNITHPDTSGFFGINFNSNNGANTLYPYGLQCGSAYFQFQWPGGAQALSRHVGIRAVASGINADIAMQPNNNTINLQLTQQSGTAMLYNSALGSFVLIGKESISLNKEIRLTQGVMQPLTVGGVAGFAPMGATANNLYPRWSNFSGASTKYYHMPVIPTAGNGATAGTGFSYSANTGDLFTQITDVTIGNTSSETSIISGTIIGSKDLVASTNTINPHFVVGKRYRFTSQGTLSTKNGSTGTVQIKVKIGGTIIGQSNAVSIDHNMTNAHFSIDFTFTVRSVGASGVMMCNGFFNHTDADMTNPESIIISNVANTINTTANRTLDVTYQWATANVDNTITILEASLEQINPTERSLGININNTIATIKTT